MTHRYMTDVDIPNLDAMTRGDLDAYAETTSARASQERGATADWLRLAARFARYKSMAMVARETGRTQDALKYEVEADIAYSMIPKRMRW